MFDYLLRVSPAVFCLIAINSGVFVINWFASFSGGNVAWFFGLFYFDSPEFSYYQLISHLFIHGSLIHLLFNMFALLAFGSLIEWYWGTGRFLAFYFISGLGAALLHVGVQAYEIFRLTDSFTPAAALNLKITDSFQPHLEPLYVNYFVPIAGASGSLFGLLMAYMVLFPNTDLVRSSLPFSLKAKYVIPLLMLIELFLGVQNYSFDKIAHFAHLGGALIGLCLAKLWSSKRRQTRLSRANDYR